MFCNVCREPIDETTIDSHTWPDGGGMHHVDARPFLCWTSHLAKMNGRNITAECLPGICGHCRHDHNAEPYSDRPLTSCHFCHDSDVCGPRFACADPDVIALRDAVATVIYGAASNNEPWLTLAVDTICGDGTIILDNGKAYRIELIETGNPFHGGKQP